MTALRAMTLLFAIAWCGSAAAQGDHYAELQLLDQRIQSLKAQALELSLASHAAQTQYLYPDEQRLRLFVTMDVFDFELDSVTIELDGQTVSEHSYTPREVYALKRGGAQELLLTNLAPGSHELEARFVGRFAKREQDAPSYEKAISLSFDKTRAAQQLELRLEPRPRGRELNVRVFAREAGE